MQILSKLRLEAAPEPNYWVLVSPLRFRHDLTGVREVPTGTRTDLASIPRFFQRLFQVNDTHREEAVVHDWLYAKRGVLPKLHGYGEIRLTRKQCDKIFLDGLKADGMGWLKRQTMYRAVRAGGWVAWRKHGV